MCLKTEALCIHLAKLQSEVRSVGLRSQSMSSQSWMKAGSHCQLLLEPKRGKKKTAASFIRTGGYFRCAHGWYFRIRREKKRTKLGPCSVVFLNGSFSPSQFAWALNQVQSWNSHPHINARPITFQWPKLSVVPNGQNIRKWITWKKKQKRWLSLKNREQILVTLQI